MKSLVDVCRMDPRFENMLTGKPVSSNVVFLTLMSSIRLEDHYSTIAGLTLPEYVSQDVREQFDIALNLAVYAWFCWEFWDLSAHKAIDCYELGLKENRRAQDAFSRVHARTALRWRLDCQSASKFEQVSASNFEQF